ncbi:MAG: polysaccharide deacetylase family protein [Terrimicrobiaceae bacterium]
MEKSRVLLTLARLAALGMLVRSKGAAWHVCGMLLTALWIGPTLRRNCQWHGPVLTRFSTTKNEVWLTIDDGPHPESTPAFLEVLDQFGAKATFFVIGRQVEEHRALCQTIIERGHSLANHSASHPSAYWWALPPSRVRWEMEAASDAIRAAIGERPAFFRPPVGMCSSGVHPAAKDMGLKVVGWSASGADGCPRAPSAVVSSILSQISPGAIILLHEGDRARHRLVTLSLLLRSLRQAGFQCVIPSSADLS